MLQRNRYLLVLVSVPLRSHVAITSYGHIVTSSTTIPVDGRTNRILSLPITYFQSLQFAYGRQAFMTNLPWLVPKTTAKGRVQFPAGRN